MSFTQQQREMEYVLDQRQYRQKRASLQHRKVSGVFLLSKRCIDVAGAIVGLILLSPLLCIVAILIKLENRSAPFIYKQMRVGKDGKLFEMYKFRSMVVNAEAKQKELLDRNEIKGAMFKMKNDPRVTRIGKFIRKTSIDELPQLVNVIRGHMSLVGPRPPLPKEVDQYTEYDRQRLSVIPGCTGLWQVSGRNLLGFEEMVELDLKYIRERSFLFDFMILLRTVRVLFGSKDAF